MISPSEEVSEEKGSAFGQLFSNQENSTEPIVSEHKATQSEELTVDTKTQKSAEPEEPPEASPEQPITVNNETSKEEKQQETGENFLENFPLTEFLCQDNFHKVFEIQFSTEFVESVLSIILST